MLKIVVFDSGMGGELFADRLEQELSVIEIIRVIDWRSAREILKSSRGARRAAERALEPYFGKVDLIIFANYLLATTSLNYFKRKYPEQKFIGFTLIPRRIALERPTLIITTKATARSLSYAIGIRRVRARTICLDTWPLLIDDGNITSDGVNRDLKTALIGMRRCSPEQVMLACGQFTELTPEFRRYFGHNVRIVDSFDQTIKDVCRVLNLKTSTRKSR